MDENLHNIDDLFKKALDEHNESTSHDVWKNIDKSLDKKKIISISKSYQKLKWVAAALLVFSAGMAMYTFRSKLKINEVVYKNKIDRKPAINKESGIDKNVAMNDIKNISANRKKIADTVERKQDNNPSNNQLKNKTNSSINKQSITADNKNVAKNLYQSKTNNEDQAIKTKPIIATAFANKKENTFKLDDTERTNDLSIKNRGFLKNEINLNSTKRIADATIISESKQHIYEATNSSLQNVLESLKSTHDFSSAISANSISLQKNSKAGKSKMASLKKSSFSATLFFSPDFVRSKVNNNDTRFREDDRNEIKNNEKIKNAFSAGLLVNYNATKRFSIQTGIAFSTITTNIFPKTIFARPDDLGNISYRFNCSAGYSNISFRPENPPASGDSISSLMSTNTLQYVSVPLSLKYNINKGRFSFQPALGLAANFLTKGSIETQIADAASNQKENINHIDGLNKMYVNGLLSFGINYNVNKILAINFTPVSRFALTSINKNAPVKTSLNSIGLQAGISLRL